jgi:ubiquitin thioesterase protein OTUB1
LTSAYLQHNPEEFQNFLLGQDIRQYCQNNIEPAVCEIEHVGVSALVNVLVKPVGVATEITYLDRTPGEEANVYRFDPIDSSGSPLIDPPTIRLLYRP